MILDTNALVALLKGVPEANEALRRLEESDDELSTTIISAYELLRGAYVSSNPEKNLAEVQELLSNLQVYDLTIYSCEEAARIYRELRQNGRLIGENDLLIAGIVKASGGTLLTRDAHFKQVKGLNTIEW
jgi:Predicted nucleic acid-binding protein, contains PIN domain